MPLSERRERFCSPLFFFSLRKKKFFAHFVSGHLFRLLRRRECDMRPPFLFSRENQNFLCSPLFFFSAGKRRASCGCRRKRGLCAFGLRSNSNRCRVSFVHFPLLLRAMPERCCGQEKVYVYRLAPEWSEPLRFRKGNAFDKKGCHVSENI